MPGRSADRAEVETIAPRLLLLDSGIGGLSVLGEIRRLLPRARIAYLADNARFPYGALQDEVLVERLSDLLTGLLEVSAPTAVVLACNTATTIAIGALRERFEVPFVGVVPAIKPAAQLTKSGAIGLLATAATVRRAYTDRLIAEFAPGIEVRRLGSARLAPLAERKLAGHPPPRGAVEEEIAPLFAPSAGPPLDVVVLGCTHYPFLLPELREAAPPGLHWLESGEAVARRVQQVVLESEGSSDDGDGLPDDIAFLTAPSADWPALSACFQRFGLPRLELFRRG